MNRNISYQIEVKDQGKTIGQFLKERDYSRIVIIELKKEKDGLLKNGCHAGINELIQTGDLLEIKLQEHGDSDQIVPVEQELAILYEDEDMLVVNKPKNRSVHPSINHYQDTLANGVRFYSLQQNNPYPFRCINRLDQDTTGVTIIAKNLLSASILSKSMTLQEMTKTYIALVEGVTETEGTINLPIGRAEGSIIQRCIDHRAGKPAITHYKRLQIGVVEGQKVSCISLVLETGRTHQIRVHMAAIGHPLIGDFLYNKANQMMDRQALHVATCQFNHPITGKTLTLSAPLPEDMAGLIN